MVSGRGAAFGVEAYVTEQDRFFGFAGAWELGTRVARPRDAHGARSWQRAIALVTASRNARVRIVATLPRSRRGPAMVRAWIAASICLAVARVSGSTGASCRARSAVRRAPWALNDALHGPAFASAPGGMRAGSGVAVTSAAAGLSSRDSSTVVRRMSRGKLVMITDRFVVPKHQCPVKK